MPEICRFYGIVIKIFFDDHNPPHFHAEYAGDDVAIDIRNLTVISGEIQPRALGLIMEWAILHRAELLELWKDAREQHPLKKIEPLK